MTKFTISAEGQSVRVSKTVSESDVYLFAGITGDLSPNHTDEAYMRATPYGRRIAHGALIVGYMSRASTAMAEKLADPAASHFPVSLGYDRIRFLKPVFIGDTVTLTYVLDAFDADSERSTARIEVTNDRQELVAVATHIMKWLAKAG